MRIFCRYSLFDIGSAVADTAATHPMMRIEASAIIIRFMAISSLSPGFTEYDGREGRIVDMCAWAWGIRLRSKSYGATRGA